MLLSWKLTPKNLKSCRKNGRNRAKSMAWSTKKLSEYHATLPRKGNHAPWTWSVKDLKSRMVRLAPSHAPSISMVTVTSIMMTAMKWVIFQRRVWKNWSNGGWGLDLTSAKSRIIRLKVYCSEIVLISSYETLTSRIVMLLFCMPWCV